MSQTAISNFERYRTEPNFKDVEWLVAQCGLRLTVVLEPYVWPSLPAAPWARRIAEHRERLLNAVHELGMFDPSIVAPGPPNHRPQLLVSRDPTSTGTTSELRATLDRRMRIDVEVVDRGTLGEARGRGLARHAIPLERPSFGEGWRETRFREKGAYVDDRWYGSVIDGANADSLRGDPSIWQWIRPPGSRARSARRWPDDP